MMRGSLPWVSVSTGLIAAQLAVALSGCAGGRRSVPVTVALREDTVAFVEMPHSRILSVTAVIQSHTSRLVYMSPCGPEVERESAGRWERVWFPGCLEGAIRIAPGDSLVMPVAAYWNKNPQRGPPFADEKIRPGRYRLRYAFGWYRDEVGLVDPLSAEIGISQIFTVTKGVAP